MRRPEFAGHIRRSDTLFREKGTWRVVQIQATGMPW